MDEGNVIRITIEDSNIGAEPWPDEYIQVRAILQYKGRIGHINQNAYT